MGEPDAVAAARKVLDELYAQVRSGQTIGAREVGEVVRMVHQAPEVDLREVTGDVLADVGSRRRIAAKTLSQRRYVQMIGAADLVFAV